MSDLISRQDVPDTNVGDMISRQAVIDLITGQPPEPHYPSWYAEQIKGFPSTEPERKKGHWIYYDEYAEAVTHTCSECGKRMTTAIGVKASYCWNCGAYMKEGEQHDTD